MNRMKRTISPTTTPTMRMTDHLVAPDTMKATKVMMTMMTTRTRADLVRILAHARRRHRRPSERWWLLPLHRCQVPLSPLSFLHLLFLWQLLPPLLLQLLLRPLPLENEPDGEVGAEEEVEV